MELQPCPHCGVSVVLMSDGTCPSCRRRPDGTVADVPISIAPPLGRSTNNSAQSFAIRAGTISAVWPLISLLSLGVFVPFGAGAGFIAFQLLGSLGAMLLGVIACIRGNEERRGMAIGLGVLGMIWGIFTIVGLLWMGMAAGQAHDPMDGDLLSR